MEKLKNLVKKALKKLYNYEGEFLLYDAKKGEGHYSLKETMKLAGMQKKSGEQIAKEVKTELEGEERIKKMEIFTPGFLNLYLSDKALNEELKEKKTEEKNEKIVIEYGNENIAKEMSVGHLRSNIIGKSLLNIFRKLNYEVETVNHLGDYGTQFGKLITAYKLWGDDAKIEKNPIEELNKIYVKFHQELEKNPELKEKGREEFRKFENGEKENRKIWQKFVDFSLKEFNEVYKILGSEFDHLMGESFYEEFLPEIVKKLDKTIGEVGENGAKIVSFGENKAPLIYQKADGSSIYATRDLAAVKWRVENLKPNKILYCVGREQSQHFEQFFEVAKRVGWADGVELVHVKNGLYKLPEGKMSTRKGNVIKLRNLIETAKEKARELLETKESFASFSQEEKNELVQDLAIGAIKFTDLSQDRETDVTFTWDKAITFEGMSGPYMQYAHARTFGILRKAKELNSLKAKKLFDYGAIELLSFQNDKERELAFFLTKYPEEIKKAARNFKPHFVARYIYELSQVFNSFYDHCSVLNAESEESKKTRLFLTWKTKETIGEGLRLLGVKDLKRM